MMTEAEIRSSRVLCAVVSLDESVGERICNLGRGVHETVLRGLHMRVREDYTPLKHVPRPAE